MPADGEVPIGDAVREQFPMIEDVARADRAFLRRVVEFLAGEAGVRQFLDVGTGLPTVENTHQVTQRIAPDARVVHVDNDPMVLAHARVLLGGHPGPHAPGGDHAPGPAQLRRRRPRGRASCPRSSRGVPSGSYVAISHPTLEVGGEGNAEAMAHFNEHARPPITARSSERVARFVDGLQVLEPGIVPCPLWRPDAGSGPVASVPQMAVVARKP